MDQNTIFPLAKFVVSQAKISRVDTIVAISCNSGRTRVTIIESVKYSRLVPTVIVWREHVSSSKSKRNTRIAFNSISLLQSSF